MLEKVLDYLATLGDSTIPGILFAKVKGSWYVSIHRFTGPNGAGRYVWLKTRALSQDMAIRDLISQIKIEKGIDVLTDEGELTNET